MPASAALATIRQNTADPPQFSAKRERIPERVRKACELLATGACTTISAAAERVGMSREWLGKMLSRSHVQAFIARETRRTIATAQMRASTKLVELLDADSEHVSLDATKHVLAIAGIAPADSGRGTTVNVNIAPGYCMDLRDSPPVIDVTPDVGNDVGSE